MNWFNCCDLFCVIFSTISTYFVGRQYLLVDTSPFEYSYGVGHSDTPTLMFILYEFAITLRYIFFGEGGVVLNTTCIMIYAYEMLSLTPLFCINVVFVIYWIKYIFNSHLSIFYCAYQKPSIVCLKALDL